MANDWLVYRNQGATRNQPLDPRLVSALGSFLPEMGLSMEVFSGGQPAEGPNRVGSHRHDYGNAADVFFNRGGQRLNWASAADRPVFEELVRRARAAGVSGIGAGEGYMQPGSMHIGFGPTSVWGAGGRGKNAPEWLRAAFYGGQEGNSPSAVQIAQAAPPDGPKGQEGYSAPAPPLPPPYDVADRPIGEPRDVMAMAMMGGAPQQDEKPTLGEALGQGVTSLGKGFGSFKPVYSRAQTPPAARVDAPDVPPINQQLAEAQRQQLAEALARLNSGRLYL